MFEMLKARSIKAVVLDVKKDNVRAIHLYKKLGFVIYEEDAKNYHMKNKL